jgi:hypothetical protein
LRCRKLLANTHKAFLACLVNCNLKAKLAEYAGFSDAPKRGNYKIRERMLTKQRIYQMMLRGRSYASIMSELGISERTFYRYLDAIFTTERDFLEETLTREELRRQAILARDRLLSNMNRIEEWLEVDPQSEDRIELLNLHAELTAAILRLYKYGPAELSRYEKKLASLDEHEAQTLRELTATKGC